MANKRVGTLEMRLRLETGEVEPTHLGVTLPDFTKWALPYILIKDEDTNWAWWHVIEGLERVCHTADQTRQGPSQEEVQSVRLSGVLYQQPTLAKPEVGVIYKFRGGGGGPVALEAVEEACKSP